MPDRLYKPLYLREGVLADDSAIVSTATLVDHASRNLLPTYHPFGAKNIEVRSFASNSHATNTPDGETFVLTLVGWPMGGGKGRTLFGGTFTIGTSKALEHPYTGAVDTIDFYETDTIVPNPSGADALAPVKLYASDPAANAGGALNLEGVIVIDVMGMEEIAVHIGTWTPGTGAGAADRIDIVLRSLD